MQRLPVRLLLSVLCATPVAAVAADGLAPAPSAFLRTHADSPVSWMTWGDAAFARAKQEQRPVFLAVGLFTSELSRAMARQTFGNAEAAAFLNENFVCVLVDAKEHPEVTALYQNYIQTKQLTGLPLNIWLTPELKPFDGANYLPPTEEWGKEGFLTVARRAAASWKADPVSVRAKADEAVVAVIQAAQVAPPAAAPAAVDAALKSGIEAWQVRFDATHGGFGEGPKYLEPELLRALLREPATRELAVATLRGALRGSLRDPLDGGFYRYAIDAEWRQPYFQKLLVDQARLSLALLDAAKVTGDSAFAEAARGTLDFALTQLALPGGDFASAIDATSPEATAANLWTMDDLKALLGEQAADFARAYGATAEGNLAADAFPGVTTAGHNLLLNPAADPAAEKSFAAARKRLLDRRTERAAPLRDDAAPSGTHGLLFAAFARAGAELSEPRFAAAAKKEYQFIRTHLLSAGRLLRIAGRSQPATAADHALVVLGLQAFAAAGGGTEAGQLAQQLALNTAKTFGDITTGRFAAALESDQAHSAIWARVPAAAPLAGDPPSAESAFLLACAADPTLAKAIGDLPASLAAALVQQISEAPEAPRGDALLALHAWSKR